MPTCNYQSAISIAERAKHASPTAYSDSLTVTANAIAAMKQVASRLDFPMARSHLVTKKSFGGLPGYIERVTGVPALLLGPATAGGEGLRRVEHQNAAVTRFWLRGCRISLAWQERRLRAFAPLRRHFCEPQQSVSPRPVVSVADKRRQAVLLRVDERIAAPMSRFAKPACVVQRRGSADRRRFSGWAAQQSFAARRQSALEPRPSRRSQRR